MGKGKGRRGRRRTYSPSCVVSARPISVVTKNRSLSHTSAWARPYLEPLSILSTERSAPSSSSRKTFKHVPYPGQMEGQALTCDPSVPPHPTATTQVQATTASNPKAHHTSSLASQLPPNPTVHFPTAVRGNLIKTWIRVSYASA